VSAIFLMFRGLAGLVSVNVCVPKVIPHFVYALTVQKHTPMYYLRLIGTKMYVNAV
jgi:hypothetical protein